MAAATVAHVYRYSARSGVELRETGRHLRLATSGGAAAHPHFFRGRLMRPALTGRLLVALSDVVRARHYVPMTSQRLAEILDPVVTSGDRVRFEVFSACASTYARVDLDPGALDGERMGKGTTNVDFNDPMRTALGGLKEGADAWLSIGWNEVELETQQGSIVEKKVKLPRRWLKGFVEVQAVQSRMTPRFEVGGADARRFFRGLPKGGMKGRPVFIVEGSKKLALSSLERSDAVRVGGVERLRVLERLTGDASTLRIYEDAQTGASLWVLETEVGSFQLALSPDVDRGFSGEGQVLDDLVADSGTDLTALLRAKLSWQSAIDISELAGELSTDSEALAKALARLGSQGLVGFDARIGAYFHRELPFAAAEVESQHPRLKAARKLLEQDAVHVLECVGERLVAEVQGSEARYLVRIEGETARCTCRWYAKHGDERGPCKHVLAVRLRAGSSDA